MLNEQKYFLILENLQFGKSSTDADNLLKANLSLFEKYLKNETSTSIDSSFIYKASIETKSESWKCTCYLLHVISTIHTNFDLNSANKDDLISIRHQNALLNAIKLASRYGIAYNLLDVLKQHPVFNCKNIQNNENDQLETCLLALSKVFTIHLIASSRMMDTVILEMIAGVYTLENSNLNPILNTLWERTSKENYFRYLLILKSINGLPQRTQQLLHKDLLMKLVEPGGFKLLVLNTIPSIRTNAEIPNWKRYDVVARIVAHRGHSSEFYKKMIVQIFHFISESSLNIVETKLVPAGVVTLRKLCSLDEQIDQLVEARVVEMYHQLICPTDLITGLVLMEYDDFRAFIKLQTILFNGSSFEALPSKILVRYLPLLIALYLLTEDYDFSKELIQLISQCLANQKLEELESILKELFNKSNTGQNFEHLHQRIGLRKIDVTGQFQLQVMPSDLSHSLDLSAGLMKILKSSNNNILMYNCFIRMLIIFEETEQIAKDNKSEMELLQNDDELDEFLAKKFQTRISVISCLSDLISFRQFHTQFRENPRDILEFLQKAIERRINIKVSSTQPDQNLPILLVILQEIVENSNDFSKFEGIKKTLKTYSKETKIKEVRDQILQIVSLVDGGPKMADLGSSEYEFARSLISESEAHLRVYGITQFIRLLTNRNEEALRKKHAILALTMQALRDEESYTYLNCIRLFVCLTNFMQAEVLEALSAEYLNENESVEFRLKIGEAILKVTEDLGQICYNYKDILINCFLHGSQNPINEFRASSLANLSTICRLLSYQVHHFFHEMLSMIESTLQTDEYLPARRASVLVLSQLLWGMDNLVDFQDSLLPIYRLLNLIVETDKDEKTRVHATNGLSYLKDKCKAFLFPEQKVEKEIKIFGIKDDISSGKAKNHILEL